jgi:hypothetical protein
MTQPCDTLQRWPDPISVQNGATTASGTPAFVHVDASGGDIDALRESLSAAIEDDRLGIPVRREAGGIHLAYPIVVLAAERPGPR